MESWRIIVWLITIGAVIIVLAFLIIPPMIWWVYKRSIFPNEKRYRTFWPRFWAYWYDGLVLMPVLVLFTVASHPTIIPLLENTRWILVIAYILAYFSPWVYSIYMHGRWGQTVGKMITRVRVIDFNTESPISYSQALFRDSVPILIALPIHIYALWQLATGVGYNIPDTELYDSSLPASGTIWAGLISWAWQFAEILTMLTNEKRRAIHDFIAVTVVVRTNVEEEENEEE